MNNLLSSGIPQSVRTSTRAPARVRIHPPKAAAGHVSPVTKRSPPPAPPQSRSPSDKLKVWRYIPQASAYGTYHDARVSTRHGFRGITLNNSVGSCNKLARHTQVAHEPFSREENSSVSTFTECRTQSSRAL
ncbi:hypothetical protein GY45DRAFT_911299 [Cubamyces sp. BRFM 1775]|nr:hypothetical protein GY45DRAFT_911299 [Cubamyces sp. BRFM 1775]